ncbi:MAG TPA: phospholipase D-like domain-containing protein [Candidatus Krumholzibacteria bacterium]|nr:phospholipase D-like domain-containing protein [Candidatus Krumholzibacteria bacterium]
MRILTVVLLALPLATAALADEAPGTVVFAESWPEHTVLDLPDLPDAPDVWRETLGAAHRIDLAGFYFSRKGDGKDAYGPDSAPDLLAPVLDAVAAAAGRGAPVRCLADAKFAQNYPDVPAWLGALPGAATRTWQVPWGGVLHAKYFLADDDKFWIGSQNFDWRALGQIHELGVLVRDPVLAGHVQGIFDADWTAAGGEAVTWSDPAPARLADLPTRPLRTPDGAEVAALVAASPQLGLPDGVPWDLPLLVEMIDAARDSVHVQLLSYGVSDREKRLFDDLDRALRRAAVRGATVRIILSNWAETKYALPWIRSLAAIDGIEVRFTSIPEHPDGFIPFARVEHAKYLTVDGNACWVGTSNWSRDYFFESRNLGLILLGEGAAAACDRFFNLSWQGPYAETVSPCGEYKAPRRS